MKNMNQSERVKFEAQLHFNNGGKSTDNPYVFGSQQWGEWMRGWGLASDKYMDQPGRALDSLESTGEAND